MPFAACMSTLFACMCFTTPWISCCLCIDAVVAVVAVDLSLCVFFASKHTHIPCTLLQALFSLLLSVLLFDICCVCVWVCVRYTHASTFKQIRRFSQSLRISQAELLIWHPLFVCLSIGRCVCAIECSPSSNGMKMHTNEWYLWLAQVFTLMSVTYIRLFTTFLK